MLVISYIISLLILLCCYLLIYKHEKSFIHVLTPTFLTFIPGNYFLESAGIHFFGIQSTEFAYFYVYLSYAIYFLFLTIGYIFSDPPFIYLPLNGKRNNLYFLALAFLFAGFLIYLPVMLEFRDLLTDPREIYKVTRTGYGISFFISSTVVYISFILFIFRGKVILPLLISSVFMLLHGSKGQVVTLFIILLLYKVYVSGAKIKFFKAIYYLFSISFIIIILFFVITWKGTGLFDAFEKISGYADVTRNGALVVDQYTDFKFGKLTLEENFYPRIPRVLFPDKPKDFGMFSLAKQFYPERFDEDTGTQNFGIVGVPFADFGYFAVFYLAAIGYLVGYGQKFFKKRLYRTKSPGDFIMFIFFAGISLIPSGSGYLLPDHFLMAAAVSILLKINFNFSRVLTQPTLNDA